MSELKKINTLDILWLIALVFFHCDLFRAACFITSGGFFIDYRHVPDFLIY